MLLSQGLAVLCFAGSVVARTLPNGLSPRQEPSPTAGAPAAQSTICGDIVDAVNSPEGFQIFWASDAYQCLSSVPFNPAVASRFLKYWNETMQFQSTLAYLKNPPEGYQQPAVDVEEELRKIQARIDSGFYKNQYAFEADFQLLTYATNDGHVQLTAGALSAFSFGSPFEITSVSADGKEAPKVYITDDILDSQTQGWKPSPIKTINGEDTIEYLNKYAALNSWGFVEPHAEWNQLMSSPALDIQGGLTTFSGGGTFYPGENLTVTFENGTDPLDTIWIAIYNELANFTGPLTTGGDFYNYFVLGELPASFDPTKIVAPTFTDPSEPPADWNNASYGAYPVNPDIAQPDLGVTHGGVVTGYFYEEISTGVLSLPTFDIVPDSIGNFSDAVSFFISNASSKGLKNVVIDLQRNPGGATLLAYTTFKNFFPDLSPFGGSRRRSFPMGNALGSAITNFWDLLDENDPDQLIFKQEIAASEWVITDRLNAATGNNFTSWAEYSGPINENGDSFSLTEQYDLANVVFDQAAFDQWFPTMYLPDQSAWPITVRPWNPDQIVLLTDGICASACTLFVEMMTRAGVKTVVAGGRPSTGPMQAASGTRGANLYDAFSLDDDILFARSIDEFVDENVNATFPEIRELGMYIKFAGFNIRDQIRKDEPTPLQFKYEAADCRIYYTLANVYNFTRLWHDVAAAAFTDPSLCVDGSTGFSTTNNTTPNAPPKPESQRPTLNQDNPTIEQVEFEENPTGGLHDAFGKPIGGNEIVLCPTSGVCLDGKSQCRSVAITCPGIKGEKVVKACLPPCTNRKGSTSCPGTCIILQTQESKVGLASTANYGGNLFSGLCYPKQGNKKLGCPANPKT
ncbi:hypothetical protein K505DRAFT_301442 [Melanomma pulvis-pyrius CBS 109.77]|uniref:Uncharacterized protein n=1 Tax=Melanomma pulvis-pyrius CBS 109.77 TaxID=1314802 RepID=A0A6A6XJR6_9PLEO|nr:hypothetical protein K505DRAFT_301442 [Melanomma pulvis-pyrius CBS 109.77]